MESELEAVSPEAAAQYRRLHPLARVHGWADLLEEASQNGAALTEPPPVSLFEVIEARAPEIAVVALACPHGVTNAIQDFLIAAVQFAREKNRDPKTIKVGTPRIVHDGNSTFLAIAIT